MMSGQPIILLKEGTRRETGRNAQSNNIQAAKAVADAVRSTLGPKGMDKMLVDSMGDVVITNDGVTILKEIDVEHPAAKMMIEVAKTLDGECGDGTTTAVVVGGELLKRAENLIEQNVHPTLITIGYRMASDKAIEILNNIAVTVDRNDKETLLDLARTAMTGKNAEVVKDHLADIAADAVMKISLVEDDYVEADLDNIKIEKKQGASANETKLIDGIIIDKERVHSGMPRKVKDAKVALINSAFEVKKTEVDAKISIRDPHQLQEFLAQEEMVLKKFVKTVKDSGANVIICQKGIDDLAQHYLAKEGIFAIRRSKKSDMEKLSKATGARIVTNINDLQSEDLGSAAVVEERKISDDRMTFVTGCVNPKAVSILVRGATEHVVDELQRALDDALGVISTAVKEGKITAGGGSAAVEISRGLKDYASTVGGREQMAIEEFANAIEVVPRTLAENAGLDPINTLINLRKAHKDGDKYAGLNVDTGEIINMLDNKVIEPLKVGSQVISSATEAAVMILRIDDVIAAREMSGPPGGPGGGMGGMPPGMM
ncbi:MAG: thermosome subunit beta [Candidatus Thermoplasmatota archaeon]|jgi:thermosome|nr:thermosome subunit beta [Candidatus Thermoplasmatota archaeon]